VLTFKAGEITGLACSGIGGQYNVAVVTGGLARCGIGGQSIVTAGLARCGRRGQYNDVVRAGLARCGIGHDTGLATCGIGGQCKLSDTTGLARGRVGGQRNVALDITVLDHSGMEECHCQSCWFQN
jgi:hypothetical protein